MVPVVGDVKDIDWFAPSGEKLLPNRQDIIVSRNDETSSTLTIYSATVDNAGIYKCVAKDGDNEAEATVNVKIYRKWFKIYKLEVPMYVSWSGMSLQLNSSILT